jgi:hypothetical protein
MMKSLKVLVVLLLITITGTCGLALAANTTTQTVTFEVQAIDNIAVSGVPSLTAEVGSSDTDNSSTYDIVTNSAGKKITGSIDTAMPANTTLEINLAAPTGATSLGDVELSPAPADLVTDIPVISESGLTITYTLTAAIGALPVGTDDRTVTLTITD